MFYFYFSGDEVLYGTTDGKVGLVQIGERSAVTKWEIDNDKKKGGRPHVLLYILANQLVCDKFTKKTFESSCM